MSGNDHNNNSNKNGKRSEGELKETSTNSEEAGSSSISCTFSLTVKNETEETRFEKLSSLKKLLQKELNKSITVEECDVVLLAGALLLNDSNAVKEQARLVTDINIRLWGNAVDSLSKWIEQYGLLPPLSSATSSSSPSHTQSMSKFIEGNTALHFAVLTGNFENIAFLLSKQADPFLKNANGDKPLELSHDYHRKKMHGKSERRRSKSKRHKSKRDKKASKSHRHHHHHHHRHRTKSR